MAERQLCEIAKNETGVAAVFVTEFPLSSRPFYTHPARDGVHAAGFDLLLRGLEVTTGGQRLHRRSDLEAALEREASRAAAFQSHLKMFDFGMPPHGGLAIGLERLTCQVLGLKNVREADALSARSQSPGALRTKRRACGEDRCARGGRRCRRTDRCRR